MNEVLKLRKKTDQLEAIKITANFGLDKTGWPDWLLRAWKDEQPMRDGSLQPNEIVPDLGNDIRVGLHTHVEIGRPGDYLIMNEDNNIGVATAGVLFDLYEPIEGDVPALDVPETGSAT